ncbi:hypothetical protein [Pseudomonas vancouverensis]|uniref:Uncharacterized protein n=1 Tax=Pseudomonas vancouverensis TaxID=95300 RepID=A0A1H2MKZ4_PSEVA|nr:hypothetical protein [Pseudomonas vancouverensis]KAB0494731.1 hypothetical protein F7R09_18975 [Pseudomonas vancouverensis]TDB59397.1 hypothetical protein EIY72_20380 [Pseudomonas vancouverensis]SDU93869.1 hypothetical protein SAMN05216558_0924 [Pseudomonas vancouverensis]
MFDNEYGARETFKGTLSIFGSPVSVISPERIGARLPGHEPTLFYFYASTDKFLISVGDMDNKQRVALDSDGYLCISDRAESFTLRTLDQQLLSRSPSKGGVVINAYAKSSAAVIQFDGDDAFDDQDTLYNFLIAAMKLERVDSNRDVYYKVPTGTGTWKKHPADKAFTAKPVPIVLNVQ